MNLCANRIRHAAINFLVIRPLEKKVWWPFYHNTCKIATLKQEENCSTLILKTARLRKFKFSEKAFLAFADILVNSE